jgi:uncharacterized membrane protein
MALRLQFTILEKDMDFDLAIGSFLLFLVIVWALNIAAKKRYKKKKAQMIYTHSTKNSFKTRLS